MTAIIKPYGILKEYIGGQAEVAVEDGQTLRQALVSLGIPPEVVALAAINDRQISKEDILQDGDVVRILAVIGGG